MSDLDTVCAGLIDKCKTEAKQLAEFTATRRKVHWTHPPFISFCVSVDDILSYGVKRQFRPNKSAIVTSSGKILRELGKTFPNALEVYNKCYNVQGGEREDYTVMQSTSPVERKVLWLRVALVDGKLAAIVERILENPRLFYDKRSVLCHPVYGEIFQSLIDGPCSIRFSRLKVSDVASSMPSPAELVNRHKKVLSMSASRDDKSTAAMPTEKAWDHVQSLYQTNSAVCLFGKNNILVKPAGLPSPLRGYLTLQMSGTILNLKWIPNSLLKDSSNAKSGLWDHVISVDVVREIAHIHCHRAPGCSAEMILIGYDGIGHPPLLFPHQPSLFMFLECLENSLLPKGCLEPPLWYLKTKTNKTKTSKVASTLRHLSSPSSEDGDDWINNMDVWNQVFRIRYGGRISSVEQIKPVAQDNSPQRPNPLPLNFAPYRQDGYESSSEDSNSEGEVGPVAVERSGYLARRDWEMFQSEVSKQLLARYFYSWLSYCRHMTKVRLLVAHMVSTDCTVLVDDVINKKGDPLSEKEWVEFCDLPPEERKHKWESFLKSIYLRGIQHSIRSKVWPYLLGVYPINSTPQERADILTQYTQTYSDLMVEWRTAEVTHMEIQRSGYSSGESSPCLSSISASPDNSPRHDPEEVKATPTSDGTSEATPSPNGTSEATPTPNGSSGATPTPSNQDDPILTVEQNGVHVSLKDTFNGVENGLGIDHVMSHDQPPMSCAFVRPLSHLDAKGSLFIQELYNIDKDIPRCDRDYWYFQLPGNLIKVRNIVCSYVWNHLGEGYSQGMCDLLAPVLVVMGNEPLAFACYLKVMERASKLFPPNTVMNTLLANLQSLLQVLEPDYYQYLTERPMGDGFFYCYRWLLVSFKREFKYSDLFRMWESIWAARLTVSDHFEEFLAMAIMKQFQSAIMDAHFDPSDILNLFTDLADKHSLDAGETIRTAIMTVNRLQEDLMKK